MVISSPLLYSSNLPLDIIVDILLRLPAKSLLRFKSVCKLWYGLISDADIAKLHLERSIATKSNLRFVMKTPVLRLADFDTFKNSIELNYPYKNFDNELGGVGLVGSCNGLLCLQSYDFLLPLSIYNPTTQTYKLLPFLPVSAPFSYTGSVLNFGFGYDSGSEDYKCVRVLRGFNMEIGSYECEVMVYSLKNDPWKSSPGVPYNFDCYVRRSVYVKDNIHWLGGFSENGSRELLPIVAFNLRDETFNTLPVPNLATGDLIRMFLGVLDGCLCLSASYGNMYCDVWVMKEYGMAESWTKLLSVPMRNGYEELRNPICYSMTRKKLFVHLNCHFLAASLDLDTMKMTDVVHVKRGKKIYRCTDVHVCVENLIILKDGSVPVQKKSNWRRKGKDKR